MASYLSNYLSLTVKIDMTQCMACMPTTKKTISQLKQKNGDEIPIPDDSSTIYLVYLFVNINFIDIWINVLEKSCACHCCAYQ